MNGKEIRAAWPKDGNFSAHDPKHAHLAIYTQLWLVWCEFAGRADLQLQLLAARPTLAKGGTEAAKYELHLTRDPKSGAYTQAECRCSPPPFALAMKAAMFGMTGEAEKTRAALARVVALDFVSKE